MNRRVLSFIFTCLCCINGWARDIHVGSQDEWNYMAFTPNTSNKIIIENDFEVDLTQTWQSQNVSYLKDLTLEGNNHTITFKGDLSTTEKCYGLLFSEVNSPLTVQNLNVVVNGQIKSSNIGLGVVVGYLNYKSSGKTNKCKFGKVCVQGNGKGVLMGYSYIGCFVGSSESAELTIDESSVKSMAVEQYGTEVYDGNSPGSAGMFVGDVLKPGASFKISDSEISKCSLTGFNYVGGIVGNVEAPVDATDVNIEKLTIVANGARYIGGLFGAIKDNIFSATGVTCSADISTVGNVNVENVGGLVGNLNGGLDFYDVSFTGNINSSSINGGSNIGGLIGSCSGDLSLVYDEQDVVGTEGQPVNIDVTAQNVGGILGCYNDGYADLEYTNVYADVKGANKVGGFIGFSRGDVVSYFNEDDDIPYMCNYKGKVQGFNDVGGIIGRNEGLFENACNDYSGVYVLDDSEISGEENVGGYVGSTSSELVIDNAILQNVKIKSQKGSVGSFIGCSNEYSDVLNFESDVCENVRIVSTESNAQFIGGFIGQARFVNLKDCQMLGSHVILQDHTLLNDTKKETDPDYYKEPKTSFGGFIGSGAGWFTNCVFGTESSPSYMTFDDYDKHVDYKGQNIGGFVGYNADGALNFESCSFWGYMQLTNRDNGCRNVGGFVGYSDYSCNFDKSDFVICNSIRAVKNIGGFVGYAKGGNYSFSECNVVGNGSGITISNPLNPTKSECCAGLIGFIDSGNIDVVNTNVKSINIDGKKNVGGFVGFAQNEAHFKGDCKFLGASIKGEDYVGGYVGYLSGKSSFGNFTDKFVFTDEDNPVTITGENSVGGFVGVLYHDCTISNAEMPSCVTIGATSTDTNKGNAGGFVGKLFSGNGQKKTIMLYAVKCVNKSNVSAKIQSVGGIVGKVETDVYLYDCHNYGAVTFDYGKTQSYGIGGIVGYITSYNDRSFIQYCSNHNNISGNKNSVGGILGYSQSKFTILDCINEGSVLNESSGTGGIAGFFKGKISNSYNVGNIKNYPGILGKPGESTDITGQIYNCYSKTSAQIGGDGVIQSNAYVLGTDNKMLKSSVCYDDLCFKSGRLAYSLEMGSPASTEEDVHFIQDLKVDQRPYLVFEKVGCMAYPDDAADLIKTDPRKVVMSLTDAGRKYVRKHIVYCGAMYADEESSSKNADSQGLLHNEHTDYFNLADDATQMHAVAANRHEDKFLDSDYDNYGNTSNNYMKVITGVMKPNDTAMNLPGGLFKTNGIWANVEFADGKITKYLSAEANEIKITDAALNSKQGKTDCIPFNLYLPMDVTVSDESKISYTRKATSSLLSIDLPFAVGSVKDSNGNDVTSKVSFGVLKSYTNENDNPTLNFEAKTINQFGGGYAPAGAYICEYTGTTPATLVFYGKDIDGNGAKVEKTYCPDAFRPTGCTLPGRDPNASSEDFYTHYTGGSGNVSILGYTCRYVMNSANWAHYYYMSKGKFYGAASQGGIFASPFRSMIYFHDSEGPMAQDGNSAKAATLSFIHFSPEDEDVETSVYRMEDIDADHYVDVYSVNGTKVRAGVASSKALEDLPAGIYVINGIKVVK